MIKLTQFAAQQVAVLGAGLTGQALAQAVTAGGGTATIYDDAPQSAAVLPANTQAVADALLLSPGVPLTHAMVQAMRQRGVPIYGDCEVFYNALQTYSTPTPIILAVTGTNGKSTTTALLGHLLAAGGHAPAVGGNIGVPVVQLPAPNAIEPAPFATQVPYVLEMSSYQAEGTTQFTPHIAVFLNLTPDHLQRHGTMEEYFAVKTAPLRRMRAPQTAVVAIDDAHGQRLAQQLQQQGTPVVTVSAYGEAADYILHNNCLFAHGAFIANLSTQSYLQGVHNAQNALAAVAAARLFGVAVTDIVRGLDTFIGLPHRLQPVAQWRQVRFVNDSKATNAESTLHALRACQNMYWILGGIAKAGGIAVLTAADVAQVAHAYVIGQDAPLLAQQLAQLGVPHTLCNTLAQAVPLAATAARNASCNTAAVVLLSPACASQDQFVNYSQRGESFIALVQEWQKAQPT